LLERTDHPLLYECRHIDESDRIKGRIQIASERQHDDNYMD